MPNITDLSNNTALNITVDVITFLNYMDYCVRVISLLVHIFYFLFIFKIKEFQSRQMIYLHNVNLVGLIYSIQYAAFITNQTASLGDPWLNDLICLMVSMIWMILKYARMYSLLLLAAFRYTSVYKIKFHREFTRSLFKMIMSIVFTWVFSLVISLILKYSFNTSYSVFYCFEGYSNDPDITKAFLGVNIILSIGVPMLLIIYLYIRILQKIKELSANLKKGGKGTNGCCMNLRDCFKNVQPNKIKTVITEGVSAVLSTAVTGLKSVTTTNAPSNNSNTVKNFTQNNKNKQIDFATQLIVINGLNIVGSIFSIFTGVDIETLTVDYYVIDADFDITRPLFRIIFLGIQTSIPILSIFLSPWKKYK